MLSLSPTVFAQIDERIRIAGRGLSCNAQATSLIVLCLLAFFTHLGAFEVDMMEARNFVTAREMVNDHHWLVPTMNGELRITKPPLPTWITAAARLLGGNRDNVEILRIPAALMASLLVLATWGLMRGLSADPILPFVSGTILATTMILQDMGRRGTWDIYCHAFMMLALWSWVRGMADEASGWRWLPIWGVFLALSFLSKGPVSFYVLLLPFLVAYTSAFGVGRITRRWRPLLVGLLIFGLLSAAWPLYLITFNAKAIGQVVAQESGAWIDRHVQPIYFYLHFPLYAGIWCPTIIAGLWPRFGRAHVSRYGNYRFIMIWLLGAILLLSIVPEKKERYLLPAAVPMAVLGAYLWCSLLDGAERQVHGLGTKRLLASHALLLMLAGIATLVLLLRVKISAADTNSVVLLIQGVIVMLILTICYRSWRRSATATLFVTTLVLSCALTQILIPTIATSRLYMGNDHYQPLDQARELAALRDYDIYQDGKIDIKDVWKVGKPIRPWSGIGERLDAIARPVVAMSLGEPPKHLPKRWADQVQMEPLACYHADLRDPEKTRCFTLITRVNPTP